MKVIDGHVFLGRSIHMDQTPESLIADMDRLRFDVSIVLAPPPGPFYFEANNFVRRAVQKYPERLVALYRANPHLEGEAERVKSALDEEGFIGVQMDPTNEGYGVESPIVEPIIKIAEDFDAVLYIHSGDSIFCEPESVADIAAKFENVKFVTTMSSRASRAVRKCGNLYLMTCPFPTLAFLRGNATGFDLEKLIFATDSPMESPDVELKRVELAELEQDKMEMVLGGNIQRIMGLRKGKER